MAPPTSGPRQTIGWPSGTKNWIEMHFTPCRSRGVILLFALAFGCPSTPSIIGMFGPVMSASSSPTLAPAWASATARLTLTVLLPTPPLPDPTAMTFLTFGRIASACCGVARPGGALDLVLQRAGRRRQLDRERHAGPVDRDRLDHVEGDDVAPELGFLNLAQSVEDRRFGERRHR